jgi:hypothetical protein
MKLHLGHVADVLHCHAHALFGWDVPVDVADLTARFESAASPIERG